MAEMVSTLIGIANYVIREKKMGHVSLGPLGSWGSRCMPDEEFPSTKSMIPAQALICMLFLRQELNETDLAIIESAANGHSTRDIARRFSMPKSKAFVAPRATAARVAKKDQFWQFMEYSEIEAEAKLDEIEDEMNKLYADPAAKRWLESEEIRESFKDITYPDIKQHFHQMHHLEDLPLSNRAGNLLYRHFASDYVFVEDFITISGDEFWGTPGIGEKIGREIISAINQLGYPFNPLKPE